MKTINKVLKIGQQIHENQYFDLIELWNDTITNLENLSKYLKLKQLVIPKTNLILPLENSNLPLINITNNNYILYNQITSDDYKITDSISHYYKITEEQVNLLITDLFNIINKNNNLYEEILKKLNISSFFEHEDLNQKKIDFKNIILSLLNYQMILMLKNDNFYLKYLIH